MIKEIDITKLRPLDWKWLLVLILAVVIISIAVGIGMWVKNKVTAQLTPVAEDVI